MIFQRFRKILPASVWSWAGRILRSRQGGVLLFILIFVAVGSATRCALLLKSAADVSWEPALLASFGWGLLFDLGTAILASAPLSLGLALLPAGWGRARWQRMATYGAGFAG